MGRCSFIFLLLLIAIITACRKPTEFRDYKLDGEFSLLEAGSGKYLTRKQLPLPALLFVGYTSCPDVCPLALSKLQAVFNAAPELREKIHIIFLSVDPKRDTPERLKSYLAHFKLPAIGLTGKTEEIDQAVRVLAAHYEISEDKSAAGPIIDHSSYVYLLDRAAKVRFLFRHNEETNFMVQVLKDFLQLKE